MFGFVLFVLYHTDAGSQVTPSWGFDQQLRIAKPVLYKVGVLTRGSLWAIVSSSANRSVDMQLFMGQCQLLNKWEC